MPNYVVVEVLAVLINNISTLHTDIVIISKQLYSSQQVIVSGAVLSLARESCCLLHISGYLCACRSRSFQGREITFDFYRELCHTLAGACNRPYGYSSIQLGVNCAECFNRRKQMYLSHVNQVLVTKNKNYCLIMICLYVSIIRIKFSATNVRQECNMKLMRYLTS